MSEPHPGPVGSQAPGAAHTHVQLPPCLLLLLPLLGHSLRPLRLGLPPVLLFFLLRQVFKVRSDVTCFAVHYKGRRDLHRVNAISPTPSWPGGPSAGTQALAERGRAPLAASPASARNEPSCCVCYTYSGKVGTEPCIWNILMLQTSLHALPPDTQEEDMSLGRSSIEPSEAMTELHPRNVSCDKTGGPGTPRGSRRTGRGASGENTCN